MVTVQLTDDAPDLATMKERVAATVAVPGRPPLVTRDYTHALRGFVIQAPPNSVNAIIRRASRTPSKTGILQL